MRKTSVMLCSAIVLTVLISGCVSQRNPKDFNGTSEQNSSNLSDSREQVLPANLSAANRTIVEKVVAPVLNLTFPMTKENIRWASLPISVYAGSQNCGLYADDIAEAMRIWESETVIRFRLTDNGSCEECIVFNCYSDAQADRTETDEYIYTVVGEGWAVSYRLDGYDIIVRGGVDIFATTASCIKPNRYMHEIGHALGLNHTDNRQSILYPYEECTQSIDQDIKDTLDALYSPNVTEYIEYLQSP